MQLTIFDFYGKPESSKDEIIRYSNETRFQNKISLFTCCGVVPETMFQSCHDYFVRCPVCKKRTKMYRHLYEAMHEWNRAQAGI